MIVANTGFGERLRALREQRGLSQYELAKRSKVSAASLSRIEQGDRDPHWGTVVKLARALGISVAEFDVETEPSPPPPPEPPSPPAPKRRGKK